MTRDLILQAAFQIATNEGYDALRRDKVATRAGVATGSVSHHFKGMDVLRTAVMEMAIKNETLGIIAQGLAQGDEAARNAPEELKRRALETLV
ncbi:MAG: TetR family transcriptional regulator [Plesiomonas sp.]